MKLEASKASMKPDPDGETNSFVIASSTTPPTLPSTLCIPAMFTATTPTITPTTLRNIEQAFLEGLNNTENESMPFQAGFVPPPATAASYHSSISADGMVDDASDNEFSMDSGDSMMSNSSDDNDASPVPPAEDNKKKAPAKNPTKKKNKGGRRPNKASNLSPEEEEKRRVRRERNKMAAARCRRRREDRTKELLQETDILETKKRELQTEVEELESEKADLEYLLQTHKNSCKRLMKQDLLHVKPDPEIANTLLSLADRIKSEPQEIRKTVILDEEMSDDDDDDDDSDRTQSPKRKILLTQAAIDPLPTITKQDAMITSVNVPKMNRPNRPNTLNVPLFSSVGGGSSSSQALNSIPIQTPSNGIFNFDSLMEGGTGLTPVHPKILGESSKTPLDLITPTSETPKLI